MPLLLLVLLFTGSLAIRLSEYDNFRELTSDKSRQLHGAYEVMQGNGVSFRSYDLNSFKPAIKSINDWPPAYSYIIAGISIVSGLNVYQSSIVLDVICLTGLWFILLWFTRLLGFTLFQQALLFILMAFAKTLFLKLYSADLFATTVFLLFCAATLNYVSRKQDKNKRSSFFLTGFVTVALMVFLKYSVLPACLAVGFSLLSYSYFSRQKTYKTGWILIGFVALAFAGALVYNLSISGQGTTLAERHPDKSQLLYLANLKLFDPFVVNAFFFLDALHPRFGYYPVQYAAALISLLVVGVMLISTVKKIKNNQATYFDHLVAAVTVCTLLFLIALSLHYPKDAYGSYEWTYVNEFRYFAPAVCLLVLYLIKGVRFPITFASKNFVASLLIVAAVAGTAVLSSYYKLTKNNAGSFENMYGRIVRAADFVERHKSDDTYFMSLTNHGPTDSEATSLVALRGTKVLMTYYNYFPDSAYSVLFSNKERLAPGKKLIVYLNGNTPVLDSVNLTNKWVLEKNEAGEQFLVIAN